MEKIQFDSGIQEYDLGTGVPLRFNPGDPNLYARFMEAAEKMAEIEKDMAKLAKELDDTQSGQAIVGLLQSADQKMKVLLSWVFGQENDFDRILGGVNLLAVGRNGKRIAANLLEALQPVLLRGAEECAAEQTRQAVSRANSRRKV